MSEISASEAALRAFGKVGLLIDDAPFARSRVARELYGSDELPEWWVWVTTLNDGAEELRSLLDYLASDATTSNSALIVVDRALPWKRGVAPDYWEGLASTSLVPQASADDVVEREKRARQAEFRIEIERAEQMERRNVRVVFLTSYPQRDAAGAGHRRWIARFHQPLFQRRREGAWPARNPADGELVLDPLLRFRPESSAPITRELDAACWKGKFASKLYAARHAGQLLNELVTSLRSKQRFTMLVTGAGMSLAAGFEHPGMPQNDWLLARAAWATLRERQKKLSELPWREPPHEDPPWKSVAFDDPHEQEAGGVVACIREYARTGWVKAQTGCFNALFKDKPGEWERTFRRHLRASVLRYDEGITQRHWFAAQLPFEVRFTTNFDGFHQRAAAYWASRVGRDPRHVISVYGGAATESKLAFSAQDFKHAMERVEHELLSRHPGSAAMVVVVGYAFRDAELPRALNNVLGDQGKLLWVAPEAHEVVTALRAGKDDEPALDFPADAWRACRKLLTDRAEDSDDKFVALPMRAVDFFYDLWELYSPYSRQAPPP